MKLDPTSLQSGVNLGGWLSQYSAYDYAHFDSFITAADIHRIADWGCDHVRLPVDYPLIEEENHPGRPNERGFEYIQRGLDWAHQCGLKVILDLHRAPGYIFDNYQAATLFNDESQQTRFLDIWSFLSGRLGGTSDWLAFELLNEIVLPDSAPWNRLLAKAVERIRQVDLERLIVIGGNYYNSVGELANLTFLADPNILYTFHFYEPLVVTHQKAHWARGVVEYDRNMEYPGIAPGLSEFVGQHPEFASILGRSAGVRLDRSTLHELLQPAFEFMQEHHCPLYCGEYGVIDLASMPTRLNWTRDFVSLLKEHSIGRAAWSYKAMDFGLVDRDGRPASQELIDIVCGD